MSNVEKRIALGEYATPGKQLPPNQFVPGDVSIDTVTLISDDQRNKVNLLGSVQRIEVYENITACSVTAAITILDSANILQRFPIVGEEYLQLEFTTPDRETASYLFRVIRVGGRVVYRNQRSQSYTLLCASPEIYTNATIKLNRRGQGSISEQIATILTNDLGSEKAMDIEATSGIDAPVITDLEPFKAIDYLRQRATSVQYPSSSFCFFETSRGYNFMTIERMFDLQRNSIGANRFFFDQQSNLDAQSNSYRNMLSFQHLQFSDSYAELATGALNNAVTEIDMITGQTTIRELNDPQFVTADSDGLRSHSDAFISRFNRRRRVNTILPTDSTRPNNLATKIVNTRAFVTRLLNNVVQFSCYGDSQLCAGDLVELNIPVITDVSEHREEAAIDSGNYLITKIRHIITIGDRPQHLVACQAVKNNIVRG